MLPQGFLGGAAAAQKYLRSPIAFEKSTY